MKIKNILFFLLLICSIAFYAQTKQVIRFDEQEPSTPEKDLEKAEKYFFKNNYRQALYFYKKTV